MRRPCRIISFWHGSKGSGDAKRDFFTFALERRRDHPIRREGLTSWSFRVRGKGTSPTHVLRIGPFPFSSMISTTDITPTTLSSSTSLWTSVPTSFMPFFSCKRGGIRWTSHDISLPTIFSTCGAMTRGEQSVCTAYQRSAALTEIINVPVLAKHSREATLCRGVLHDRSVAPSWKGTRGGAWGTAGGPSLWQSSTQVFSVSFLRRWKESGATSMRVPHRSTHSSPPPPSGTSPSTSPSTSLYRSSSRFSSFSSSVLESYFVYCLARFAVRLTQALLILGGILLISYYALCLAVVVTAKPWLNRFFTSPFTITASSPSMSPSNGCGCATCQNGSSSTSTTHLPIPMRNLDEWVLVEPTLREGDVVLMSGTSVVSTLITAGQLALSKFGYFLSPFLYSHVAVVVGPARWILEEEVVPLEEETRGGGAPESGEEGQRSEAPVNSFSSSWKSVFRNRYSTPSTTVKQEERSRTPAETNTTPPTTWTTEVVKEELPETVIATFSEEWKNTTQETTQKMVEEKKRKRKIICTTTVSPLSPFTPPPFPPSSALLAASSVTQTNLAPEPPGTSIPVEASILPPHASTTPSPQNVHSSSEKEAGGPAAAATCPRESEKCLTITTATHRHSFTWRREGAVLLEAMVNSDSLVPDIHGEVRVNCVQCVYATDRLWSRFRKNNKPAYDRFAVRHLLRPEGYQEAPPATPPPPATTMWNGSLSSSSPAMNAPPGALHPSLSVWRAGGGGAGFDDTPLTFEEKVRAFAAENEGRPLDVSLLYFFAYLSLSLHHVLRPQRLAKGTVSCSELIVELYQTTGAVQRKWEWCPLTEAQSTAVEQRCASSSSSLWTAFPSTISAVSSRKRTTGGGGGGDDKVPSSWGAGQDYLPVHSLLTEWGSPAEWRQFCAELLSEYQEKGKSTPAFETRVDVIGETEEPTEWETEESADPHATPKTTSSAVSSEPRGVDPPRPDFSSRGASLSRSSSVMERRMNPDEEEKTAYQQERGTTHCHPVQEEEHHKEVASHTTTTTISSSHRNRIGSRAPEKEERTPQLFSTSPFSFLFPGPAKTGASQWTVLQLRYAWWWNRTPSTCLSTKTEEKDASLVGEPSTCSATKRSFATFKDSNNTGMTWEKDQHPSTPTPSLVRPSHRGAFFPVSPSFSSKRKARDEEGEEWDTLFPPVAMCATIEGGEVLLDPLLRAKSQGAPPSTFVMPPPRFPSFPPATPPSVRAMPMETALVSSSSAQGEEAMDTVLTSSLTSASLSPPVLSPLRAGDLARGRDGLLYQLRWRYTHPSLCTCPFQFTDPVDRTVMNYAPGYRLGPEIRMEVSHSS